MCLPSRTACSTTLKLEENGAERNTCHVIARQVWTLAIWYRDDPELRKFMAALDSTAFDRFLFIVDP